MRIKISEWLKTTTRSEGFNCILHFCRIVVVWSFFGVLFTVVVYRLVAAPVVKVILVTLSGVGSINLLTSTVTILVLFSIVYIIFRDNEIIQWLDKNQGFLVVIASSFALIIFLLDQSSTRMNLITQKAEDFQKVENALIQTNQNAKTFIDNLIQDLVNDNGTFFWNNFPVEAYGQYADHIRNYYTSSCQVDISKLKVNLETINNINSIKRSTLVGDANSTLIHVTAQWLLGFASTTRGVLSDIEKQDCKGSLQLVVPTWWVPPKGLLFHSSTGSSI